MLAIWADHEASASGKQPDQTGSDAASEKPLQADLQQQDDQLALPAGPKPGESGQPASDVAVLDPTAVEATPAEEAGEAVTEALAPEDAAEAMAAEALATEALATEALAGEQPQEPLGTASQEPAADAAVNQTTETEAGAQESSRQAEADGSGSTSSGGGASTSAQVGSAAGGGVSPLALAALLPLAAAGGGGGGGPVVPPLTAGGKPLQSSELSGRAVDGYVKGATVFYDANANGLRDAGEASVVTAADGSYTLDTVLTAGGRMVLQAGGIDTLTGQRVGMMVAPAGYTGINPFTMLLASSPGASEPQLKAALDISSGIDLNSWDPIADMQSTDATLASDAQAAFIKAQQVFAVVQAASALYAHSQGETAGLLDVTRIAGAVAQKILAAQAGDDWNQTLSAALDAALASVVPDAADGEQQALAEALKSALTQLLAAMQSGMAVLADALQSGDHDAVAASMAAVAAAQDVLLDAAQAGNAGVLSSLADPEALARLMKVYETAIAQAAAGEQVPVQIPVLSLEQVSEQFPDGPWILADTAANLAAKAIMQHGPDWFDSAIGVIVLDAATAEQAIVLVGFPNLSFVQHGLAPGGEQSLAWDEYQALRAAGLQPQGSTDLNLTLPAGRLSEAITQAAPLHAWGIRHLDVDGDQASISEDNAAAMIAAGLDFHDGNHVVLQVSDGHLDLALDDLYALGVDQISSTGGNGLEVSFGQGPGDRMPVIDSQLQVTLQLAPADVGDAAASASQLSASGIDLLQTGGPANLSDSDAHSLAAAGLAFVLADHVAVQAEGTVLQSSLSDLQQLAVDEVGTGPGIGTLHLNAGGASFGAAIPKLQAAANVVLHLQAARLGDAIEHAQSLQQAGIDQFDVDGGAPVSLTDLQAAALVADGLSFVASDLVAVHAGGTHLQNSLHDLQHLGVDEVHSVHGSVVVQHGGALDPLQELPVFDAALDVSLAVTPADLSQLLLKPQAVATSHIDHLRVSGLPSHSAPPTQDGQSLDQALAASGADLVLEGSEPLALTDDQAARLLLAGRLQVEESVQLAIVHSSVANDPTPDALEVSLKQLAELGADHVEHVQGANLLVHAGVDGVNLEQELEQLLAQLPTGGPLFGEAQVTLDVGVGDVNAVSNGLAAELKLLGVDNLVGEDGLGHAIDRPLA